MAAESRSDTICMYVYLYVCMRRKQLALALQAATRPDLKNALLQLFDYFLLAPDTRRSAQLQLHCSCATLHFVN